MGTMIGHMTGAMACYGVWLGDELGLYRGLAGAGPVTAATSVTCGTVATDRA